MRVISHLLPFELGILDAELLWIRGPKTHKAQPTSSNSCSASISSSMVGCSLALSLLFLRAARPAAKEAASMSGVEMISAWGKGERREVGGGRYESTSYMQKKAAMLEKANAQAPHEQCLISKLNAPTRFRSHVYSFSNRPAEGLGPKIGLRWTAHGH